METDLTRELQETRQLLKETEEMLNYGLFNWDVTNDHMNWSDGMFRIFGYPDDSRPQKVNEELLMKHIDLYDQELVKKVIGESVTNECPFELEYNITTTSNASRIVFSKGKVMKDGSAVKLVGFTRDITEIRLREKEREKMIRDLNRSNMELEEFAYVASHDLQEPLRKISTFSERLNMRAADSLSPEGMTYLSRIVNSTENMRALIEDLLEFSRVSRHQPDLSVVDLGRIIEEVKAELELIIEESAARIEYSGLPEIEASQTHIRRLFTNLIGNAIKFRKADVAPLIRIVGKKMNRHQVMKHNLIPDRTYYCIRLEDNGIGFEEEYALRIFQIFQRLHAKAEYPGSGIGLAICKKIADNHGGTIFAEGQPGRGSVFYVILPEKQ